MKDGELYKRRIVEVLNYFDEERDLPWDYVARSGDGRFEAFATHMLDYPRGEDERGCSGEAVERSLGIFDSCDAAVEAIRAHLKRVELAERDTWQHYFTRPINH